MRVIVGILAVIAGLLGAATPQAQAFLEQLGRTLP